MHSLDKNLNDVDTGKDRLAALEALDILDTPSEPEFDDIAFVASIVCRTPVALVSLVERDRQWFKARIGFEACETPISQSVCAHALEQTNLLIIPDLATDRRTRTNTLVTGEPGIRFYAGAPLIMPDGVVIGTLCVIDTAPRPQGLDDNQAKALEALARQVVSHLRARHISQRKDELFKRQKQISASIRANANRAVAAQEAARIGTFEVDVETGLTKVSAEFCRIFDVEHIESYPASTFEAMIHPEDGSLHSSDDSRRDGTAALDIEYRVLTPRKGVRWVSRHATFRRDDDGTLTKMLGTVQDVTAQKRAAARVQALLDLGDRLRNLDDPKSMAIAAADLMAKALDATRAGFGIVNRLDETVDIQPEWRAPGIASVAGIHPFSAYGSFIGELKRGDTIVIGDVTLDKRTRDKAQAFLDSDVRVLVNVPIFDHDKFSLIVFVHHNHPYDWTQEELAFVRSFGDRIQSAIARVQAEAEQELVNSEISHRLKNTFAMVQAIATQTLRPVAEREHVLKLEQRLHALSSAHDILFEDHHFQDHRGSASVASLVTSAATTLGVFEKLHIRGPEIFFGPRGALSLSLLLHELLTNAVKYGALSVPEGTIDIHWATSGAGEKAILKFSWREKGGPPANQPDRNGFGSKLIRMGLIGTGGVEVSYTRSGFTAELSASLDQLQRAN